MKSLALLRRNSILIATTFTVLLIVLTSLATVYVKYKAGELRETKATYELISEKTGSTLHFITQMDKALRGFLLVPDDKFLAPYVVTEYIQVNFDDLEALLKAQDFPYMDKFLKAKLALADFHTLTDKMIALRRQGDEEAALKIYSTDPGSPAWTVCAALVNEVDSFEKPIYQRVEAEYEASLQLAALMQLILFITGAPTLLFVIHRIRQTTRRRQQLFHELQTSQRQYLFASQDAQDQSDEKSIINRLIQSLEQAAAFIKQIAQGNYAVQWEGLDEANQEDNQNNLAGALIRMREQMKIVKQENQQRLWTTEGLSKVAEITRIHQQEVQELADRLLSYLVNYTEANQGSLFFLQEDVLGEVSLSLSACFAYDKKKHAEKTVKPGQGLVGQTFLEKKTLHLKRVPSDYVQITSGLGEATPTALLVVPLTFNEQVLGILEIASFNQFAAHQIKFLETVGEVIASAVATVRMNAQTKQLLTQSQEGTESLRAQEEEMRQNMEELQATQEEMQRKAQEYEAVIQEQEIKIQHWNNNLRIQRRSKYTATIASRQVKKESSD